MIPANILEQTKNHQQWIEDRLRQLVETESPTEDAAAVNSAADLVQGWAGDLGGSCIRHKTEGFGDILEITFGTPQSGRKPLLLLGHLDTVWPMGTLARMPWKSEDGRLWGPGVLDMKSGVVMALAACKMLKESGLLPHAKLLLNSEEEVGSPVSRRVTERLAREASAVFVLEPAQVLAYKTARKGIGHYVVAVKGVAAHSGVDFERGHSAIRELARLVEIISNLTDLSKKRTVNCGVIAGGTRSNVVAEEAHCEVDVRIATTADGVEVDRLLRSLQPTDPHCVISVTGGINRPPMERSPAIASLYHKAKDLAGELGFHLDEASTGGGSDGNFTAALGTPTLDGMGSVGAGAHAPHESIEIEHVAPRTALLAAMIAAVGGGDWKAPE